MAPATQDALLDRFTQMEASLRALREDMAADRRATGDLLRAVQAELQAFRAEGARALRLADRSEAVDAVLEAKLGEFGRAMAALAGRLGAIDKLAASDNWQALGARLEAVEGRIGAQTTELAGTLAGALSPRLQEEAERHWQSAGAQQIALEASVRAQLLKAEEESKAREHELEEIHEAVAQLSTGQQLAGRQSRGLASRKRRRHRHRQQPPAAAGAHRARTARPAQRRVQARRQEHHEDEARRGNGFKRWLYGTGSVFAASRRTEAASVRQTLDRSRDGEKS